MHSYTPKEEHKDKFIFIKGNTKFVRDCTQTEREFLYKNGRKSWFVKKIEDNSGGNADDVATEDAVVVRTRNTNPKKKPVGKVKKEDSVIAAE